MKSDEKNYIELALAKIQSDLDHIKIQTDRVESFTYSLSKKVNETDKNMSFIKGGFYVFVAVFSIALSLSYLLK
tara:strand:- start:1199 stop:1420 length:222 start_codon:yes stop_codon:yes gene_type:complete